VASIHCFPGQVKKRTSSSNNNLTGSHVMEYGDKTFKDEKLFLYQGFDPANVNNTNRLPLPSLEGAINQRDADILFMWKKVKLYLFLRSQLTSYFLSSSYIFSDPSPWTFASVVTSYM
jgi:hypothetical protein